MPAQPSPSPPQSPSTETTHDHPLAAADTPEPEHTQPGTAVIPAIPGVLERSTTTDSWLDTFNRVNMPENTVVNNTPPPTPHTPTPNNHARDSSGRRNVRPTIPDPVIAAPSPPRVVVHRTAGNQPRLTVAGHILAFFGYGRNNRARKELVSIIWTLVVDFSQIIAIITFLTISTHRASPTILAKNEWDACGKPLGTWDAFWVVRLALDVWLGVWRWSRERTKRLQDESHANTSSQGQSHAGPGQMPYPRTYARLSLMGSTFTLVWFVLAQIFLYSSAGTCRRSSPHLWWLTFGLLGVMYLMILEVVFVAILVFVVGPILFLFWSILLLCLGRHPSQNPHHFTPDIGQVSRSVVDKIPLVLYIPPSPDQPSKPVTIPSDLHTYPPQSPTSRRRFPFLPFRRRGSSSGDTAKSGRGKEKGDSNRPLTWEDNWEKGEYPFVQLDSHRASCAICLLDFQEPKRVDVRGRGTIEDDKKTKEPGAEDEAIGGVGTPEEGDVTEQTSTPVSPSGAAPLRLQDAGEGAQPLRLLNCGHVFHKTCVDPWLLDVSGRCPVCQRPVRGDETEGTAGTEQEARPARRRWFRRNRRRGPA
ncbi:hypothetical protein BJV78DRAFT_1169213 [Lactifluus subvellereus]|nr:hypothetical protein BJV78DRAFT_1169213 [Lactifluus subvellereus]